MKIKLRKLSPIVAIIIAIFIYFFGFELLQLTALPGTISWMHMNLLVGTIAVLIVIVFCKAKLHIKLACIFTVVWAGFMFTFVYTNLAYWHASGICSDALQLTHVKLVRTNPIESNGFNRQWNLTEKCAGELLPFPWGRKAVFK